MSNDFDIDALKLKIEALSAKDGDVVVVYMPPHYSMKQWEHIGGLFSTLSDDTGYNFVLVPKDIKLEVLPRDVKVELTKK